ncbi:uncharacterized protein [Antedon mediterranea]|uniref:uncharacterized protein n=1 Tax=Antedon mediterranea TaxID=105859 RepID=UPI003AF61FC5
MTIAQLSSCIFIFCYHAILCTSLQCTPKQDIVMVNNSSDCFRECEFPAKPRLCEFEFTVAWGYTLAAACTDCPDVREDCSAYRCYSVDGTRRPIITVNDMSPGPSIQVCHGDTIRVKVNNELQDGSSLTIHWHGIHQVNTVWADGVPMITQCPIPSPTSFVYEFVADPPGTHWWHSHVGVQRGDGMYGALIVREPRQKEFNSKEYDFDLKHHYILFNDWLNIMSLNILIASITYGALSPENTLTLMVNGRGQNENTDVDVPPYVLEVEHGFRFRIRFVNSAIGECNIRMIIESHPITIIATDGYEVEPIRAVDALLVTPGERLDIVLEASSKPASYCIYLDSSPVNLCEANGTAILRYKGSPATQLICNQNDRPEATSLFTTKRFINKDVLTYTDTHALQAVDPDLYSVDVIYYVVMDTLATYYHSSSGSDANSTSDHGSFTFVMNQVSFKLPDRPFVSSDPDNDVQTCNMAPWYENTSYMSGCKNTTCSCPIVAKVKLGQVVEMVVISEADVSDHPMHLHGQSFRVLGQSEINMTAEDLIEFDKTVGIPRIPLESTVVKDTVNMPAIGYVIIRWKAENPGYWFFHCHIEYHTLNGMAMVVQVGEKDEIPDPPKGFPSCGPWSPNN